MSRADKNYLLGYILGDGMLRCYGSKGCEVKITEKNYSHITYVAGLITKIYKVKPTIVKEKIIGEPGFLGGRSMIQY